MQPKFPFYSAPQPNCRLNWDANSRVQVHFSGCVGLGSNLALKRTASSRRLP
jgi:hypothetical protein